MNEIKRTVIECMLVSLRAREQHASSYTFNDNMQSEAELLRKQIKALEAELEET